MDLATRLVHEFPPVTGDSFSEGRIQPVPVDVSEVSKLCQISEATIRADLELVCETRRHPRCLWRPANAVTPSGLTKHFASATGITNEGPVANHLNGLRRPRFELLRPSVVIRRRPQRDQILGSNLGLKSNF